MKISIFSSIYIILQNMGRKKEICIYDRTYLTRGKMAARRKETIPFCVHTNDAFLLYWYPFVKPETSCRDVGNVMLALTSHDLYESWICNSTYFVSSSWGGAKFPLWAKYGRWDTTRPPRPLLVLIIAARVFHRISLSSSDKISGSGPERRNAVLPIRSSHWVMVLMVSLKNHKRFQDDILSILTLSVMSYEDISTSEIE